jgi:hypothetical protein
MQDPILAGAASSSHSSADPANFTDSTIFAADSSNL